MPHRAAGALAEVVVLEDAVLYDAKHGRGGADGYDEAGHGLGPRAPCKSEHDRDHEEEQNLFGVDDADAAVQREKDRDHGERRIAEQRTEEWRSRRPFPLRYQQCNPATKGDGEQDL